MKPRHTSKRAADVTTSEVKPERVPPLPVGRMTLCLRVSDLDKSEKKELWSHLLLHHPEQAASLKVILAEPSVRELIAVFNASVLLDEKYVPASLRAFLVVA